jgi:N-acetylglutamate synthase-like GNAT family acetyltransferase
MGLSGNTYKILVRESERKGLLEGIGLCENNSKMYLEELGFEIVNKIDVTESVEHSWALVKTALTWWWLKTWRLY